MGQNMFSVISTMTSTGIRVRNGAVFRVGRKSNLVAKGLASPSTWRPNNFGRSFRILLVVLFSGLLRQSLAQTTGEVRLAWVKSLDIGGQLAVDVHGDIYLVGWKDSPAGGGVSGTDTAIRKFNGNGNVIWSALYHDPDGYSAKAGLVGLDSAGNIYAAGPVFTACPFFQCFAELVLKYDAQGNLTWSYRIQPLSKTGANACVVTPLGNVCVAGWAEALEPPPSFTYMYYSPVGLLTQGVMYVFAAATDEDSNLYLSGLILNKYGPSGSLIWSTNQIGSGRNVAVGKGGSVYAST